MAGQYYLGLLLLCGTGAAPGGNNVLVGYGCGWEDGTRLLDVRQVPQVLVAPVVQITQTGRGQATRTRVKNHETRPQIRSGSHWATDLARARPCASRSIVGTPRLNKHLQPVLAVGSMISYLQIVNIVMIYLHWGPVKAPLHRQR
uniref:Uncharacterized protein n=1 Tax=Hippocampus comes TaxID=109280 RepID=A0A3Q2ZBQ0_HIPCM